MTSTSTLTAVTTGAAVTDAVIARAPSRWSRVLFVLFSVVLLAVIVAMVASVVVAAADPMAGT